MENVMLASLLDGALFFFVGGIIGSLFIYSLAVFFSSGDEKIQEIFSRPGFKSYKWILISVTCIATFIGFFSGAEMAGSVPWMSDLAGIRIAVSFFCTLSGGLIAMYLHVKYDRQTHLE